MTGTYAKLVASPPIKKEIPSKRKVASQKITEKAQPVPIEKARQTLKNYGKGAPLAKSVQKDNAVASSNHATVIPRNHDTALLEDVRKATRQFGKEAATHRFTQEEKQSIAEIVFQYKQEGLRTSENEIVRVAINWIVREHQQDKKNSFLNKALNALHR